MERTSHPSSAQIEALLDHLAQKPYLAKGFLKNQNAKVQSRREWDSITLKLNSIGGGTHKTTQKWMKYWADKKSAVKKKAGARAAARRRTGGGIEDVPELNEIEERILALMGGEKFATGDIHLQLPVFDEPTASLNSSPSILHEYSHAGPSTSTDHFLAATPATTNADIINNMNVGSPQRNEPPYREDQPTSTPTQIMVSPVTFSTHMSERNEPSVQDNSNALSSPRRRRVRMMRQPPPSQRRSHFSSVTERFLKLEESRLALENRLVTVLESNYNQNRLIMQSNIALVEGLQALIEIIKKN